MRPTRQPTSRAPIACVLAGALTLAAAPACGAAGPVATVKVGGTPGPIAINPAAHLAYVGNQGDGTVSVINTISLAVIATLPVGGAPAAIAADPPVGMAYVSIPSTGQVAAIAGSGAPVLWPVGGAPRFMVVDVALNRLFVADTARDQVEILDAQSGALFATVPVRGEPSGLALDVADHILFVATTGAAGSVVAINGTNGHVLKTVGELPAGLTSIAVNPDNSIAGTVSPSANSSTIIDGGDHYAATTTTIDLGCGDVIPCSLPGNPNVTIFDPGLGIFFQVNQGFIFFTDATYHAGLGSFYGLEVGGNGVPTTGGPLGHTIAMAANPNGGQLAALFAGGGADILDTGSNPRWIGSYHRLTTGTAPVALAFDPAANRLFITNGGDATVSVYGTRANGATAAYEGSFGGNNIDDNSVDANPATGIVYTLRLGTLFAIDEAKSGAGAGGEGNNTAGVTAIPLANASSSAVVADPATNKVYVGDSVGAFYSVDGATNVATPIAGLPATADIRALALDPGGDQIVAWDYHNNNLLILAPATDTVGATLPIGSQPGLSLLVDAANARAYVVGLSLVVVDLAAKTIVTTVTLPSGVHCAALNAAMGRLYVGTSGRQVLVIDTATDAIVETLTLTSTPQIIGIDPVTGKFYVSSLDNSTGPAIAHLLIYDGATNKLIKNISATTNPLVIPGSSLVVDPLTDTIYMGSEQGSSTETMLAIDGHSNALAAIAPAGNEFSAFALALDKASGVLAGTAASSTGLWFPTSQLSGGGTTANTAAVGIADASTLASAPIFRTRAPRPRFSVTATSTGPNDKDVPKQAFFQVDGWQAKWTPLALAAGTAGTGQATIRLPTLRPGLHFLYTYVTTGDVATTQSDIGGGNSPIISPIAATVFTVER